MLHPSGLVISTNKARGAPPDLQSLFENEQYKKIADLYNKDPSDKTSQYYFGVMTLMGFFLPRNIEHGKNLLFESANKGEAKARLFVAFMYDSGLHLEKNAEKAKENYEAVIASNADKSDIVKAQYNLGVMYQEARFSTLPDYDAALDLFLRAGADGCFTPALNNLGFIYANGLLGRVERDNELAFFYYQQAAERRDAQAAYNLGTAYLQGIGREKDLVRAYKWFRISSDLQSNNKLALDTARIVSTALSSEQIQEAIDEADSFLQFPTVSDSVNCRYDNQEKKKGPARIR